MTQAFIEELPRLCWYPRQDTLHLRWIIRQCVDELSIQLVPELFARIFVREKCYHRDAITF